MNRFKPIKPETIIYPILALLISMILGAFLMLILGFDPILAYRGLIYGSVGSLNSLCESFNKAVPIVLTGLSFALANRCGMINLGAEGQLYIGALVSVIIGAYVKAPAGFHMIISLLAGFMGGALFGSIVAFLKNRFKANELIVTIMLNYIAASFVSYLISGPLRGDSSQGNFPQSALVSESAKIPTIFDGLRLHGGIVVALIGVMFYYIFLWHTSRGFEMRVVGLNYTTAECSGINIETNRFVAMVFAGGFAGLAGATELLAAQFRILEGFVSNYGYDGVAVALVGNGTPVGILLSGFLFGALRNGANRMQVLTSLPSATLQVIQSLIVIFVVGKQMFRRGWFFSVLRNLLRKTVIKG